MRRAADEMEARPGFFEIDLVAHYRHKLSLGGLSVAPRTFSAEQFVSGIADGCVVVRGYEDSRGVGRVLEAAGVAQAVSLCTGSGAQVVTMRVAVGLRAQIADARTQGKAAARPALRTVYRQRPPPPVPGPGCSAASCQGSRCPCGTDGACGHQRRDRWGAALAENGLLRSRRTRCPSPVTSAVPGNCYCITRPVSRSACA